MHEVKVIATFLVSFQLFVVVVVMIDRDIDVLCSLTLLALSCVGITRV